jgi:hypothetical protein
VVPNFEKDLKEHGFFFTVINRAQNGVIYRVEVPIRMADVFATYVNSNFGMML